MLKLLLSFRFVIFSLFFILSIFLFLYVYKIDFVGDDVNYSGVKGDSVVYAYKETVFMKDMLDEALHKGMPKSEVVKLIGNPDNKYNHGAEIFESWIYSRDFDELVKQGDKKSFSGLTINFKNDKLFMWDYGTIQ